MKKKLVFDATWIAIFGLNSSAGRSGIFFVCIQILKGLLDSNKFDIYIYLNKDRSSYLKEINERYYPEYNLIPYNDDCKYLKIKQKIDKISTRKAKAKKNKKQIKRNFYNILLVFMRIYARLIQKLFSRKVKNIDIFFSPIMDIPKEFADNNVIKKYLILYDCIPLIFPEFMSDWYHALINSLNSKDKYFAISRSAKNDFIKYVPELRPEQITVTPLACSDNFYQSDKKRTLDALKKYNLPLDKKYVFSLCSLEPRKNLIRAVKTFVEFIKKNNIDDMVFVMGGGHWDSFIKELEKEISDLGEYKDKIIRAGYIDDEDLAPLYSGAEWFVYTSKYEGFGLPPLEAMQCGCPVITSNNSSLPEVVGDAGIMIDWDSDEQHIAAYEKYYFDKKYRDEMAVAGLERAKMFSWDKTVDIMLTEMLRDEK